MKNIFKLMGIALIASSMAFVSCGSDDDETYTINVQFGDKSWSSNDMSADIEEDMINASIFEGDANQASVTFKCPAKDGSHLFATEGNYARYYENDDATAIVSNQTGFITIESIDVAAHTITGIVSSEMGELNSGEKLTVTMTNANWK
ncbi:MAG: hypothetical protein J6I49_00615 [Bacteroidales bacterium]|nr:hypothetical protein [Bacteroidales bacterium]